MAVIWCRHCRMPLTPEETSGGTCPVCGGKLDGVSAPAKPSSPPVAKPTAASHDSWWLLGVLIALLLAALILHPFLNPEPATKHPIAGKPGPVLAQAKNTVFRFETAGRSSPRDSDPGSIADRQADPGPARGLTSRPKKTPMPLFKFPQIFENGNERTLNLPEGQYRTTVTNRTRLKLKGVVKTLKIDLVENDSELDATGLAAQEIILGRIVGRSRVKLKGAVTSLSVEQVENNSELDALALDAGEITMGRILGRSRVKLLASVGKVDMRGQMDNQSSLMVQAVKGSVVLSGRIDDAIVIIMAREVDFRGIVAGTRAQAMATLTSGGKLKFRELTAGARLSYRKANAGDSQPIIQAGIIAGNAKFTQIK